MQSYFISGTDTYVGKTIVTAGLARFLSRKNVNVGIMKPFAAGIKQKKGFASEDVQFIANAAKVNDPENLINPQFVPIPSSPYTAYRNLGIKPDIGLVLSAFSKLQKNHDILLVEGIGGIMTPILDDYFVINLIKDMKLNTIVVTSSRIGSINHTLMTVKTCNEYGVNVRGIIINNFEKHGYPVTELKRDLESLTRTPVLGSTNRLDNLAPDSIANEIEKNMNTDFLLN